MSQSRELGTSRADVLIGNFALSAFGEWKRKALPESIFSWRDPPENVGKKFPFMRQVR